MREIKPIFIIGAPRSGTSITTWALGQHPNIQPMPETAWIASMAVGGYLSYGKGSERGRFSHLSNVQFPLARFMGRLGEAVAATVHDVFAERRRQLYGAESVQDRDWSLSDAQLDDPMQIVRSGIDPKRRWVDGTPMNTFYIWGLAQMFPHALFLHNLRRPEEVATSLEAFDKVGAEPQALEQGLEAWISHTENAWYAECGLGRKRVFRIEYERISETPEVLFREVCDFLGENFSPDCLLPLRRKLNSSQAQSKHDSNMQAMSGSPVFQRAKSLYDLAIERPGRDEPDAHALGVLRQRFQDYCAGRSLV